MKEQPHRPETETSLLCRIRAVGRISEPVIASWTGLRVNTLSSQNNRLESEVQGCLPDQSALIGVINHLYNLGYRIVAVECETMTGACA